MTISLPPKGNSAKVLDSYFSPLRVQAQAAPDMTVQVAEGSFWLADNTHQEYIGGTTPTITKTLNPNTSKWVIVTVTKNGVLTIENGDASASPVLPLPEKYRDELPLAAIFVTDTTTAITNEMIFDIRPLWSVPVDSISQDQLNGFAKISWVNDELVAKADTTGTPEAMFKLNVSGTPLINYSGIEVRRSGFDISPGVPDVGIRFNETAGSPPGSYPHWEFSNDAVDWQPLGLTVDLYYTKAEADLAFTPFSHLMDDTLHITANQNIFLDDLDVSGSPLALSGADVNKLIGITGNVQTLLDDKLGDVTGTANNIAILTGAPTNELTDSGWTVNDGGTTVNDLWSASQITIFTTATLDTKADKIIPAIVGDIAGLDATGNLIDTTWALNDATVTNTDMWSGQKITTELSTKLDAVAGTLGHIVEIGASGILVTTGIPTSSLVLTSHTHVKVDITDFVESDYVHRTGNESIAGLKTFDDNVVITGDLTVGTGGSTASLNAATLSVFDKNITINDGTAGPTSTSTGAGLTVDRAPATTAASLVWDDATTRWKSGLEGTEAVIGLEGISLVQPFYEIQTSLGGSPLGGIYTLPFAVPSPAGGFAALQVFVNGIKQIEGAGKAYQANYTGNVVVTFETGSEPTLGADVEFYGFGYLA